MIYDGFYDPPLLSWWSSPPPAAWDAGTAPSRTGSGSLLLHLQAVGNHFTEIAVTSLINHLLLRVLMLTCSRTFPSQKTPDFIISYISGAERLVHPQPLPLTQGEEGAGRGDRPHHHPGLQLVQEQEAERPGCRDIGVSHLYIMTLERSLKSSSVTTSRVVTALFVVL